MAGKVNALINAIYEKRANGNPTIVATTRTKLILKGINPDKFGPDSPDDPSILQKVEALAKEFGVSA